MEGTTERDGAPATTMPGPGAEPPFRRIVEGGADGVAILDADGAIVYANPAAAAMLGRPVEQLLGRPLGRPVTAGRAAEIDVPAPGGACRIVELRPAGADWGGRPALVVGLRDVTAYRRLADAQRFLAEAGAELARSLDGPETLARLGRLVVEHLADGCLIDLIRADGSICREVAMHADPRLDAAMGPLRQGACVARGGAAASGLPRVLTTGRAKLYSRATDAALDALAACPERREAVRALGISSMMIVPLIARGRILGALTLLATRPGRHFSAADLPTASELAYLGALALDNARLYDEAREAVRRRDEFLAMLSHELRNPLASIVTSAELLRAGVAPGPARSSAVEVISRQSEQMTRLLGDLLDISRVTRGIIRLDRRPVDLLDVLDRALPAAMPAIEAAGHRLHFSAPAGPIALDGDATRLSQVIVNLLTNAARYTPRGGNIWLDLSADGGLAELVVRDDGIGIEPELMPRIFDLFSQGSRGLDRSQGGLGIGLTLVKTIVELHGGAISAASAGPDRGSTFRVLLPLAEPGAPALGAADAGADADEVPGAADAPEGEGRSDLRLLVVEDHDDNREMLCSLLELAGYRVETASDGVQALEALRRLPDLALMDLGLPLMDGLSVVRAARREAALRDLPIVAVTGYAQPEDRAAALAAGFDAHLSKPVRIDELESLLARLLRRPACPASAADGPAS